MTFDLSDVPAPVQPSLAMRGLGFSDLNTDRKPRPPYLGVGRMVMPGIEFLACAFLRIGRCW